jgi:hypothetical protein
MTDALLDSPVVRRGFWTTTRRLTGCGKTAREFSGLVMVATKESAGAVGQITRSSGKPRNLAK